MPKPGAAKETAEALMAAAYKFEGRLGIPQYMQIGVIELSLGCAGH